MRIDFYQNEGDSRAIDGNREITRIGHASVDPPAAPGRRLEVEIIVDANRKLSAFAGGVEVPIQPRHKEDDEPWTG